MNKYLEWKEEEEVEKKFEYDPNDWGEYTVGGVFLSQREQDIHRVAFRIKNYARQKWGTFEPDWEDEEQKKYMISYFYDDEKWVSLYSPSMREFSPFGEFEKREHAGIIIEEFKDELNQLVKN